MQCSDNTWQAYNRWPNNYSIYTHPKGTQGPWADVSFDRPYGREAQHDVLQVGGLLITSLLSSLPAWRYVDPLPVLGRLRGDDDEDDESLESIVESSREPEETDAQRR